MDAGIIYYKNQQDAEESFEILRKRLFSQHPNDIFRLDYE